MVLVFGGAYQGKLVFALEQFGIRRDEVVEASFLEWDTAFHFALPAGVRAINHIHGLVRKLVLKGVDPVLAFAELAQQNPELVVLCDEMGSGVVPLDKEENEVREQVGKVLQAAAARSKEVYRVLCGIGMRVK